MEDEFDGLFVVFALKGAYHGSNPGLSSSIDLVVGGLALLLAVALATRADARFAERRKGKSSEAAEPNAQKGEPVMQRILSRESTPLVFLAALVMNVPGAAYLVALKDITAAHHHTGTTIVLVVAFNLIMFILAEVPLLRRTNPHPEWLRRSCRLGRHALARDPHASLRAGLVGT